MEEGNRARASRREKEVGNVEEKKLRNCGQQRRHAGLRVDTRFQVGGCGAAGEPVKAKAVLDPQLCRNPWA